MYIDETGTQTLKVSHADRYLCLVGVIMRRDSHDRDLTERLHALKSDVFGHSSSSPVILHRRDMVRGTGRFEALKNDPFCQGHFEYRWLELLKETNFLVIACAIDKAAHIERYRVWQHDPYHYSLEMLLERYVKWMSRHGLHGDVLVEGRSKFADKRLKRAYARFYDRGNTGVSAAKAQERLTSKEIKFATKADDVAGHQLADSLAHPLLRHMKTRYLGAEKATGYGAKLVDFLIESKLARKPKTDLIDGWGLKWLP